MRKLSAFILLFIFSLFIMSATQIYYIRNFNANVVPYNDSTGEGTYLKYYPLDDSNIGYSETPILAGATGDYVWNEYRITTMRSGAKVLKDTSLNVIYDLTDASVDVGNYYVVNEHDSDDFVKEVIYKYYFEDDIDQKIATAQQKLKEWFGTPYNSSDPLNEFYERVFIYSDDASLSKDPSQPDDNEYEVITPAFLMPYKEYNNGAQLVMHRDSMPIYLFEEVVAATNPNPDTMSEISKIDWHAVVDIKHRASNLW